MADNNQSQLGLNGRIVRFFLEQKQLTAMLLAIIVIMGVGSFFQLRVEGFPAITVPVAIVSTVVPGAGPETINDTVTVPVENSLRDLKGLKEITSTSQKNISFIVLTFNEGVDTNIAIQDARTLLESVKLPTGIDKPTIQVPETGTAPFFISVSGPASLLDLQTQSKTIEEKLLAVKGVKSFTQISGVKEKIYIDLPPQYFAPSIIQQIQSANIGFPLGTSVIDGKEIPVSGAVTIQKLEDIRNLVISLPGAPGAAPRTAKLSEIASVYVGYDDGGKVNRVGYLDEGDNKFKIQPALLYQVTLNADTDLLKVTKDVEKTVEGTKAPDGKTDYTIVFNQGKESQRQVDEIVQSAIGSKWGSSPIGVVGFIFGGIWLLIIGMLLFLDWRSALISALAIPLSFLTTFIFLYLMGIQMNTLVLFSFILVIGLIVDPAIVVLESIKRYMEIGYKGRDAVLRSIDVIGFGLFIAVLTSLIVFIPFSIVSGTFGQIIKYIPLTVFPALIASYFVPLIFLTWLAAKFLKADNSKGALHDEDDVHTLWPIARWFIKTNRAILNRTWLQILVIILGLAIPIAISAGLFASGKVRQVQFAQPDDVQNIQLTVPTQPNQTPGQLQQEATDVENILKDHVNEIQNFFYADLGGDGGGGNGVSVFITLKPVEDRDIKSSEIAKKMQEQLQSKFGDLALVKEFGAGPPEDAYPVSVKIFENDPEKLKVASQKIADQLRSYKEVASVITDNDQPNTELVVNVDQEKAASAGVNAAAVYGQIAGMLGEKNLFRTGEMDTILRVPEDSKPNTVAALQSLEVPGVAGVVRLGDIASINESAVPGSIRRAQGDRYAQVSARLNDSRDAINVQRNITDWAKSHTGDLGLSDRAFEDRVGVNEFEKSFQQLFLAIFLSILVTYAVFVLFFKSFIQPLIILFAIPLILIGVFPALAFFAGGQFGFLETIGILMVIGIAENVGIFLIDYANRKVKQGMNKKEAIAIASGIRFRPIILTKVTALAGLLPLAVFSPFWRGLALVVIFGILSSGILSLFTTPVLYNWLTRVKKPKIDDMPADEVVVVEEPIDPPQDPLPMYGTLPPYERKLPSNLPIQN